MVWILVGIMFFFLIFNFPMMLPMTVAPLAVMALFFSNVTLTMSMQQLIAGISSPVLLSVPMFILAADIMCTGKTTNRLLDVVESFLGHIRGGMAMTTAAACTIFGAISGSTQATVVAIGKPMRNKLRELGYKDPDAMGLIISAAIIALLIPPSISMIMYAVVTGTSVGSLFIAGVVPGLIMMFALMVYSYFFAVKTNIPKRPKATWAHRLQALKKALAPMGFPVIIFAGIYSGMFSPVEAAAVSVLYAVVLEMLVYRSVTIKKLCKIALSTGIVTCAVFVMVSSGQLFSWVISYAKIPQMLTNAILGPNPSAMTILVVVTIFFFVAGMFVDSLIAIIILSPIFFPVAMNAGIDPIHLGIIITLQAALSSISPPFGCNIFTAGAIFNQPFLQVIKGLPAYLIIYVIISVALILFPQLSLVLL